MHAKSVLVRTVLALLLAVSFVPAASAATTQIQILLDVDNSSATGCDVATPDGNFPGAEHILTTTVTTSGSTASVTAIDRRACVNPATDTFGPPVAVPLSPGEGGVGIGNGTDGFNVVETYFPASALPTPRSAVARVGVISSNGVGGQDGLLVTVPGGASPILIALPVDVIEIPTASGWGLIFLALLLAGAAAMRLRKHPVAAGLALLLLLGTAGLTFAAIDGNPEEWDPSTDKLADDTAGDAPVGADIRALFGKPIGARIVFRVDISLDLNGAPTADDDAFNVNEGGTLNPAAPGVLNGDTDPDGDPLTAALVTGPSQASSFVLNADGSFSYTHNGSETTTDSFTYRANDGLSNSNVATVTITINGVNDAPVADNDAFNVNEGGTLNAPAPGVLDGDTDPESNPLTAVLVAGPAHSSSFTLNADGSFSYTHDGTETPTTDSFTYQANDGTANSNIATVTITINAGNDAPTADDDAYAVNEGGTLAQPAPGVLDGDTDPEGSTLTAVLVSGPAHSSSFTLNADGSFSYTHDGSETPTTDTFTYQANDGTANSNVATVTITINAVNDGPTADNDSFNVNEGGTLNQAAPGVLDGDTDPEGSGLTAVLDSGPSHASSFTLNADGSFSYTHDGSETPTTDTFTYHANDGTTNSNIATVTITINGVNDAPVADNDAYSVSEGGTLNEPAATGVLNGDVDPESNPLTAVLDSGPSHASSFTLNADGSFSYTHDGSDTPLTDTFTYHANDGTANSNIATVTITINVVNDAPVLDLDADDSGGTGGSNYAITFTDGDPVRFIEDTVDATITDIDSANLATLTVTLTNLLDAGDEILDVDLTGADPAFSKNYDTTTDPNQGVLTITASPTRPVAEFVALLRKVTYINNDDDLDTTARSIQFVVNDGASDSNTATTTVTMVAANDAPTADNDAYAVSEGGTLTQPAPGVLDGDTDPEGSGLTAVLDSGPSHASSFTLNADGSFTYTHDGSETPTTDTFTYHATDGSLSSNVATVTITINGVNDAPTADNDAYAVNEGATLTQPAPGVLDGDTDPEGTTLTAVLDSGPSHASSFTLNADGSFTYTHDGSETPLTDTFTYHATDGTLSSNVATVTITINAVNDAPTADNDAYAVNEGATLTQPAPGVLDGDTDPEGSGLTAVLNTGPAHASSFTLNADGSFTYTHDGSEMPLTDTFTYRANDGTANSNIATVTITITPVNDAPVADNDAYAVNEGGTLTQSAPGVLDGDTDVDSGSLTAVLDSGPAHATSFTLNADGSFSYVHNGSETLTDSFTYHATDGAASSNVATVTITINPVNDPPVANADAASITEEAPNVPAVNTVSGNVLTNDTDPDSTLTVSAVAGGTVGLPRAGSFGSVTINSNGSYTYTLDDTNPTVNALLPGGTLIDAFGYTASDGSLTSSSTLTVTINGADDPATPDNDAFDFIGNTELRVDLTAGTTPAALEVTPTTFGVVDGDLDPEGGAIVVAGIVGCADVTAPFDCALPGQGTVSLQSNGRFSFVPDAGDADPTASFQYTLVGNPSQPGTVTLTRFERVWYVKNDATAGGLGRSNDPFDTLIEAQTASSANDYIFVYLGDGTAAGQSAGIALKNGQHLIGQHAGLSLPVNLNGNGSPTALVPAAAGSRPLVDDTVVDVIEGVSARDVIPAEVVGMNLAGNVNGIDWTTTAAFAGTGTFSIRDNVVRSATSEGVDINLAGTGAVNLAFHDNNLTAGGTALDIQETGTGALTITAFANNVVGGNTGGSGIVINAATFDSTAGGSLDQVLGGTTVIGASGNGVGGAGFAVGTMTGRLTFADLDVFADSGAALSIGGTGPLAAATGTQIDLTGAVSTLTATGGPAASLSNLTSNVDLQSLSSTNSTTTGVSLTNVGGTFATGATGTAITNATGTDFAISGGTANVTYRGTVTDDVGQLVSISGATGGTKSFTGAITDGDDGDGSGISLTGNTGATVSFSGGLLLSTGANAAFAATGGGTVNVCDEDPCAPGSTGSAVNRLTTTTGTALNVANTTIGPNHLEFRSISAGTGAAGPANGILLNNTGASGSLRVKGTGSAGSGGTIQDTTSHGISLTTTFSPSFDRMNIDDTGGSGIKGTDVTNVAITNCAISDSATALGTDESNIAFNTQSATTENNLDGVVTITGNTLTNAYYHGVDIFNFNGTVSEATISNNIITSTASTATSKGSGIRLVAFGSATTVGHVTKATLDNNVISNFPSGAGIVAQGGNAGGVAGTFGVADNAANIIAITNNRIAGNSAANRIGINAIQAVVNGSGQGNFNISNNGTVANPLTNVTGNVIVNSAIGDVTVTSTIANNVIVANHTAGVGGALGISLGADSVLPACAGATCDTPDFTVTVNGNAISQTDAQGILARSVNNVGSMMIAVTNNNVAAPLSGFREGIQVHSGSSAATGDTSVCLEITGNTSAGSGGADGIGLRKQGTNSTLHSFAVDGMAATSSPGVETYVHGLNSSADGALDGDALGATLISATSGFSNCNFVP